MQRALDDFESALADGPQMELEKLERLVRLWNLPSTTDDADKSALAVEIEQTTHRQFHAEGVYDSSTVSEIQKTGYARL